MSEEPIQWSADSMLEITLKQPDDFLKIRETLSRIGVASRKDKILYQSCHILHKQGKYYIVHFKELFALDGKHANLLFYEDPDYRFVINALIKKSMAKTTIHDHGKSWTLYGVVDGSEEVLRFNRIDGGKPGDLPSKAVVEEYSSTTVGPGYVDFIKPWEIHAEYNRDKPTIAVIVRSQKCGTYIQNIFYKKNNSVEQYYGPDQIPFHLG